MWLTLVGYLPVLGKVKDFILKNKWIVVAAIIAILVFVIGIQTYRLNNRDHELADANTKIEQLQDDIARYKFTITLKDGKITDLQQLIKDNERSFRDYVEAQQDKGQIILKGKEVQVEKGQENQVGVVDVQTSDKIKDYFRNHVFRPHDVPNQ